MDQDQQQHFDQPQISLKSPEMENKHQLLILRSKYLLWSLQFMVSLSVLSLFVSYLPGISLYCSYTYYFSTFFLPLLTRALDRKYVFLLCNGIILVFLVGLRGLNDYHHPPEFEVDVSVNSERLHDHVNDTSITSLDTDKDALEDGNHEMESNSLECQVKEEVPEEEKGIELDNSNQEEQEEEDDEEEERGIEFDNFNEEEQEEEEEEGEKDGVYKEEMSGCTNEELNKKCDEFIRKMKEELRFGANEYHLIPA